MRRAQAGWSLMRASTHADFTSHASAARPFATFAGTGRYPDLCKERADRDAEELKRLKAEGKARFRARAEEEEAK